jgi:UDP-N-acetylmuramyl pentapeptide phosphotransferase/UDP-N-acetylglucosamine-1-phosphate transferase
MNLLWLLAGLTAAAVLSLGLCRIVIAAGFKDAPTTERKAQVNKVAVPTAGGVGIAVAAYAVTVIAAALTNLQLSPVVLAVAAGGLAAMVLGLCDDRLDLNALLKLAIIIGVCVGMTVIGVRADVLAFGSDILIPLPVVIGAAGSVLWLIVVINAVNFMDGANGLSMGMAAIASLGLAVCGFIAGAWDVALLAATLAGALGGFLVWNVSGKLFVGDAGALMTGAILGGLSLVLVKLRPDWLFVPPTLLMPFLSDVLLTLAWRAKHGKSLTQGHRDHAYQIAMKGGMKHWHVAAVHAFFAFNAFGLGVIGAAAGGWAPLVCFLVLLAVSTWIHLRVRHSGVKAGLVGADIA